MHDILFDLEMKSISFPKPVLLLCIECVESVSGQIAFKSHFCCSPFSFLSKLRLTVQTLLLMHLFWKEGSYWSITCI